MTKHPDEKIINEVQPLLNAQSHYIEQLETELHSKTTSLRSFETLVNEVNKRHEADIVEMTAKFKLIECQYSEDAIETKKQLHLIELEREENDRLVQLYRTQNEVLDTQNRQYSDKLSELESSLAENNKLLEELRTDNITLTQANAAHKVQEVNASDHKQYLTHQMESKAADLSSTSEELGRVREDLAETKTQLHLAKDQLRMVEDFMKQVQASKQEDEQRWLFELDSAKRRLREYESTQSKHDVLVEQLRFANRSLTAEVAELKKDSACMGQLLEDESGKVEGIADRERALNFEKIELKMQKQEIEAQRQKLLIQIGANEKLSMELKEKQEEVDVELQHRITNIMENECLENSKKLQQCEKEIYEVNRSLATEQA